MEKPNSLPNDPLSDVPTGYVFDFRQSLP